MAILAASSNIALVAGRESVESDLCNDQWVEVREWPRALISMVTNELCTPNHLGVLGVVVSLGRLSSMSVCK